jgi:hypothetical protein
MEWWGCSNACEWPRKEKCCGPFETEKNYEESEQILNQYIAGVEQACKMGLLSMEKLNGSYWDLFPIFAIKAIPPYKHRQGQKLPSFEKLFRLAKEKDEH